MKLISVVIAAMWALLFVASAAWINDVPRKPRMFESPELRGQVDFGFPLVFGSVEYIPDYMSDEKPSRFLHANAFSFRFKSVGKLFVNLGIVALLATLNFWGVRSVCGDSIAVTVICSVLGIAVGAVLLLCLAGAMFMPDDFTILDEAAMLLCVVWLAFAFVSLRQIVDGLTAGRLESNDY